MKSVRLGGAILLAAGLLFLGASQPRAMGSSFEPPASACTAARLAHDLNSLGAGKVVLTTNFGCEGPWSYLWADVKSGTETIGVTVVLRWRADLNAWWPTNRVVTCVPSVLPETIYRQGCFSN